MLRSCERELEEHAGMVDKMMMVLKKRIDYPIWTIIIDWF